MMTFKWKQEPDLLFFVLIGILFGAVFLACFKIDMLCVNETPIRHTVKYGQIQREEGEIIKHCLPIVPYFKKVKELRDKNFKESAALITQMSSGSSSLFSFNSSEFSFDSENSSVSESSISSKSS